MRVHRAVVSDARDLKLQARSLFNGCHYCMVSFFGFQIPVKQQRVIRATPDGKIVFPGLSIMQSPKSNTTDLISMLVE